MTQTKTYTTAMSEDNGGLYSGLDRIGSLPTLVDASDATMYITTTGDQSAEVWKSGDSDIPTGSTVTQVIQYHRLQRGGAASPWFGYIRYVGGVSRGTAGTLSCSTSLGTSSTTWATDPASATWTVANVWLARFGCHSDAAIGAGQFSRCYIDLYFTLPTPTAVTDAATDLAVSSATLNGTIGPNTATAAYDVSYYFQYGLTDAYGSVTGTVSGLTGSSDQAVSAGITGLPAATLHHFRVVASTDDGLVYGSDETFTTAAAGSDTPAVIL